MAMTQLALLFIGTLATLATLGLFVDFGDRWTRVVIVFGAAILWGLFGLSSFDVIVRDTSFATASEPITPLAYLGFGMAGILTLYAFYEFITSVGTEAAETDMELAP